MAMSSQSIAANAGALLQDKTHVTWTIADLATWINEGCRELVRFKPSALSARVGMRLAAGTRQNLDGAAFVRISDGAAQALTAVQLLDVGSNLGAAGTAAGRAVTLAERKILDTVLPTWPTQAATGEVRYVLYDPKEPRLFQIYPQARANPAMYLELVVARLPVNTLLDGAVALGSGDIDAGLDALYESALVDYVLYRAYSQETESPGHAAKAQWHYQSFGVALGVKLKNEFGLAPRSRGQQAPPAEGGM